MFGLSRWGWLGSRIFCIAHDNLYVFFFNLAGNSCLAWRETLDLGRFYVVSVTWLQVGLNIIRSCFATVFVDIMDGEFVSLLNRFFDRNLRVAHDVLEIFLAHGVRNSINVWFVSLNLRGFDLKTLTFIVRLSDRCRSFYVFIVRIFLFIVIVYGDSIWLEGLGRDLGFVRNFCAIVGDTTIAL